MKKIRFGIAVFIFFVFYGLSFAASSTQTKWGYKGNIGPYRWGELDPAYALCADGKTQSPINIPKKAKSTPYALQINYKTETADLSLDGVSHLQIGNQQVLEAEHAVQINFDEQDQEFVNFHGEEYRLIQFHIHTPSENTWRNLNYPLEIHFVHQGTKGKVLVIGVFAQTGAANTELQKIVDLLLKFSKNKNTNTVSVHPSQLLPAQQNYYQFAGSLTTPPCTEGLEWAVMATPITVSPAQIAQLKQAAGGANARPLQESNKRAILFATQ